MNLRSIRDIVMIVALALAAFGVGYVAIGLLGHGAARSRLVRLREGRHAVRARHLRQPGALGAR